VSALTDIASIFHGVSFVILGYAIAVLTWIFYLAAYHLIPLRDQLHPVAKAHAYVIVGIGLVLDAILNIVVATIAFGDLPREWLLTTRLKRYKAGRLGWRRVVAYWVCEHLLNQFDEGHC